MCPTAAGFGPSQEEAANARASIDQLISHFEECYRLTPSTARKPKGRGRNQRERAQGEDLYHRLRRAGQRVRSSSGPPRGRRGLCLRGVRPATPRHSATRSTDQGAAEFTVRVNATSNAGDISPCDFGIFATKSQHTRAAAQQTAHLFRESGAICSVQNGLGNEEIVAEHNHLVIRGATTPAAGIGPFEPSGTPYGRVVQLAEIMNRAGLKVVPLEDARGAQWTKLIFNSAVNAVGALTQLHHGAATRFAPTAALYEAVLVEGEAVAKALGIPLHGDPREMIEEGAGKPGKRQVSMLQDVLAQRPTEIDFVNGAMNGQRKSGFPCR
jgi:2-dehydropantoate 2-reductase